MNNALITEAIQVLNQLKLSLSCLSNTDYNVNINALSHSTIGGHTRHIIELFQILLKGYKQSEINYDDRERNFQLQTDVLIAVESIDTILKSLPSENKDLSLITTYNQQTEKITTNYYRELLYNIEHCIHHQALLKVAFIELELDIVSSDYGLAKSTKEYISKTQS